MLKTTQARFTLLIVGFFALLLLITVVVIKMFVAPQLTTNESRLVRYEVDTIGARITEMMNRIQAQQRSITESAAVLDSAAIDTVLPALVNQYQDVNVFGGGIWPLPKMRDAAKDKFSTFLPVTAATPCRSTPSGTPPKRQITMSNPGIKTACRRQKASVPGRKPIRMRPVLNPVPTARWASIATAQPGALPPST